MGKIMNEPRKMEQIYHCLFIICYSFGIFMLGCGFYKVDECSMGTSAVMLWLVFCAFVFCVQRVMNQHRISGFFLTMLTQLVITGMFLLLFGLTDIHFMLSLILGASLLSIVIICSIILKSRILRILFTILLCGVAVTGSIFQVKISVFSMGAILFCMLTVAANLAELSLRRELRKKQESVFLAPIFLLLILVVLLVPINEKALDWSELNQIIKAFKNTGNEIVLMMQYKWAEENPVFQSGITGFGREELGNELNQTKQNQISLMGTATQETTYVVGKISNYYTGHSWEVLESAKQDFSTLNESQLQKYELLYCLSRSGYDRKVINEFLSTKLLTLQLEGIKVKSLFYIPNTYHIIMPKKKKYDEIGPNLYFENAQYPPYRYEMQFVEMDYLNHDFEELLRDQEHFSYQTMVEENESTQPTNNDLNAEIVKDISAASREYLHDSIKEDPKVDALEDVLLQRSKLIKDEYTQLPEELPKRVYELADTITLNCDNDYDRLRAIEAYLLTYKYTKDTKKYDPKTDFVDSFLFDSKEGYCTYFASSMAVLARCLGIPTRYVEGYVVPETCSQKDEKIMIAGTKAHAWVEAYIEGYGWVPFEPTATYYHSRYLEKTEPVQMEQTMSNSDYYRMLQGMSGNWTGPVGKTNEVEKKKKSLTNVWILGGSILCISLLLVGVYYLSKMNKRKKQYKDADSREKILIQMNRFFFLLKESGCALGECETLREYEKRVLEMADYVESKEEIAKIFEFFEVCRYGNIQVLPENSVIVQQFVNQKEQEFFHKKSIFYVILFELKKSKEI